MNTKLESGIPIIASAMLVLCALLVSSTTLYVLVVGHWHGPFRDMWEIFPFLQKIITGTWSSTDLWESYGYSHRLFIPKLLFIADHKFFDATNHLLIFVSVACQIFICILFYFLLWREKSIPLIVKYFLISIVISLQFSATLLFNFLHTFDVQWFLCCLSIVAAFYCISYCDAENQVITKTASISRIIISGLLIASACLSNFSGMAAWPIWILLIFSRYKNLNLKFKITLVIAAVIFVASYASGIRGADITHENIDILKYVYYIFVAFPFAYLANPISDTSFIPFLYSACLIILALYLLAKFWWRFLINKNINQLSLFLACIGLFAFGVAVVTAIGRGYDPSHAYAMRYQNIVMLFWSAMILLSIIETRDYLTRSKYILCMPFMLTFAALMCYQYPGWNQNIWLGYQVNRAHLALMMGYSNDVPMIAPTVSRSMIYVPGYNLERERAFYEQVRMGIYQGDLADLWLKGASSAAKPDHCANEVLWSVSPYQGPYSRYFAFSVSGLTRHYNAAALVDESGRVLALAIPDLANNIFVALRQSLGFKNLSMHGFAVSDKNPSALIMVGDGAIPNCESQLN